MPALSMFFGVIVRMQSEKGGKHNKPHIHALYGDNEIVVGIDGEVLEGNFPNKQMKLLLAWMAIHEDELRPTAVRVEVICAYQILVEFNNGEKKRFDVEPYMKGEWYGKLRSYEYFKRVFTDGFTVVWPDGQDICPDELYSLGKLVS